MKRIVLSLFIVCFTIFSTSALAKHHRVKKVHNILVYCGTTMFDALQEVASIIEKQEGVNIRIVKDGSNNLLKSILFNYKGDLYMPGDEFYIKKLEEKREGSVIETSHVGYNKAVIMVQKGNPKKITNDLNQFTNPKLKVVLGNPQTASIGKQAKIIFEKAGIYNEVMKNVHSLKNTSKSISESFVSDETDLAINQYASSRLKEFKDHVETIEIDSKYYTPKRIIIGLLKYSRHPKISRKIMKFIGSSKGKTIFKKYGLYFDLK